MEYLVDLDCADIRIWRNCYRSNYCILDNRSRSTQPELKQAEQCDPPNTYPLARRVRGRYAPGTRRASGPVPVIADVRKQ